MGCERGANDEEPVSVFDDTITFFHAKDVNVRFDFLFLNKQKKKKKNFLPLCPVA